MESVVYGDDFTGVKVSTHFLSLCASVSCFLMGLLALIECLINFCCGEMVGRGISLAHHSC